MGEILMHAFHLHLYGRSAGTRVENRSRLSASSLPTLICDNLAQSRFDLSFEQMFEALSGLERMHIELDGSFVWRGSWDEKAGWQTSPHRARQPWQLDGMLYDCNERVHRVELKGSCPAHIWSQFFSTLGWPSQPLIAHVLNEQCFVDVDELVAYVARRC